MKLKDFGRTNIFSCRNVSCKKGHWECDGFWGSVGGVKDILEKPGMDWENQRSLCLNVDKSLIGSFEIEDQTGVSLGNGRFAGLHFRAPFDNQSTVWND